MNRRITSKLGFGACAVAGLLAWAQPTSATVLFSENFDSYANGTALSGQGGWVADTIVFVNNTDSMSPSNSIITNGDGLGQIIPGAYATQNSGIIYYSLDYKPGGNRQLSMHLDNGNVNERMGFMYDTLSAQNNGAMFAGNGFFGADSLFPHTSGIWYQIVLTLDLATATITGEARNYTADGGDPAGTVYNLGGKSRGYAVSNYSGLRVHVIDSTGLGIARYDNVLVSTTAPAFTPIPEPATLALVGMGGLMMLRRRR